jgi:hypothetical protein
MSLKGELTDLSLAELIEFFCNQRKTGRLTVSYPHAPAYFYLQSGSVVHASVGSLRGIDAVYYALTQSNASFNFSAAYEPPDQTINQPWTSVVLEGLRRMDEGIKPRNPFPERAEAAAPQVTARTAEAAPVPPAAPTITEPLPEQHHTHAVAPAQVLEKPLPLQAKSDESFVKQESSAKPKAEVAINKSKPSVERPVVDDAFLSSTQTASSKFSYRSLKLAVVFAALVLVIAGIAVPWGWRVRGKAAKASEQQAQPLNEAAALPQASTSSEPALTESASEAPADASTAQTNPDAADAARREREARAREEARQKAKAAESNESATAAPTQTAPAAASTSAAQPAAGPKKAVVQVTYDENGRVTQASGSDPTALRIARQKRFPPGKAGSATLTIPIN